MKLTSNLKVCYFEAHSFTEAIESFTNPVVKSLQRCQSKMARLAVANRLAFLYANMFESTLSCDG